MATPRKTSKTKKKAAARPATKSPAKKATGKKAMAVNSKTTSKARKSAEKAAASKAAPAKKRPAAMKKASTKPTPASRKPAVPKTPKKVKPKIDADLIKTIRELLITQRREMLHVVQSTQAQMAHKSGDLADVSDRASEGIEDELAIGLMAIEAAKLDDIEAAIHRIDDGSYGICLDCNKAIPRKRLEVLPFALRCLPCEGLKERRVRTGGAEAEEDED